MTSRVLSHKAPIDQRASIGDAVSGGRKGRRLDGGETMMCGTPILVPVSQRYRTGSCAATPYAASVGPVGRPDTVRETVAEPLAAPWDVTAGPTPRQRCCSMYAGRTRPRTLTGAAVRWGRECTVAVHAKANPALGVLLDHAPSTSRPCSEHVWGEPLCLPASTVKWRRIRQPKRPCPTASSPAGRKSRQLNCPAQPGASDGACSQDL